MAIILQTGSGGVSAHSALTGLTSGDDHSTLYVSLAPSSDTRNVIQPSAATIKGLVLKGFASQTDNLLEMQDSAGSVLSYISPTQWRVPGGTGGTAAGHGLHFNGTVLGFYAVGAGHVALSDTVGGVMSWSNSIGEIIMRSGYTLGFSTNGTSVADTKISRSAAGIFQLGLGSTYHSLILGTAAAGTQPLRVRGTTSQTADLQQWLDVSANVLSTISENGYFTTRKTSAPADGELAASEVAWWFDAANGASQLMVKGKSADGTVVSGAFALA